MKSDDGEEAEASDSIVDISTGETVGFMYLWEDGGRQPLWLSNALRGRVYMRFCRGALLSEKRPILCR